MNENKEITDVYHGSYHILEKPLCGVGRKDNDYGSGFYITQIKERAEEWALLYGSDKLLDKYKIDTDSADIIPGYRADDSYGDVIEAFMSGEINVDEVVKLFYKGELVKQIFIKSRNAFERINFFDSYFPCKDSERSGRGISVARREVLKFLENRRIEIVKRFVVPEITVADAVENDYVYNKEYGYYEKR